MTEPATGAASPRPTRWAWWAFAWGLAEATCFFIVPEVLITRIALRDFRRALVAGVFAVAGALIGGTALWLVSDYELGPRLLRWFTYLPGISGQVVANTGQELLDGGASALFPGTLLGEPYKVFAVHAGVQKVPLAAFLLVSAAAQLLRLAIAAALAASAARLLRRHPTRVLFHLHTLAWLAFYLIYWLAMR